MCKWCYFVWEVRWKPGLFLLSMQLRKWMVGCSFCTVHMQFESTFVYLHTQGFILRQKWVLSGFIASSAFLLSVSGEEPTALTTSSDQGSEILDRWYQPACLRAWAVSRQDRSKVVICSCLNSVSGVEMFHHWSPSMVSQELLVSKGSWKRLQNPPWITFPELKHSSLPIIVYRVYCHVDIRIYLEFIWMLLDPHPQVFVLLVCQLDFKFKCPDSQVNYILLLSIFLLVSSRLTVQGGFWREPVRNITPTARSREERLREGSMLKEEIVVNIGRAKSCGVFSVTFVSIFFQGILPCKICPLSHRSKDDIIIRMYTQMQIDKKKPLVKQLL